MRRSAIELQFRAWPYKARPPAVAAPATRAAIRRDALAMQFRAFPYKMRPASGVAPPVVGADAPYIPTYRRRRR